MLVGVFKRIGGAIQEEGLEEDLDKATIFKGLEFFLKKIEDLKNQKVYKVSDVLSIFIGNSR